MNEINTKKRNVHDQRENVVLRTQRNLYFTDSCSGFALGVVEISALALGVMQILALLDTHMLLLPMQIFALGADPTQSPNASRFASQWNIGLTLLAPLTPTPVLKGGNLWCPHKYG